MMFLIILLKKKKKRDRLFLKNVDVHLQKLLTMIVNNIGIHLSHWLITSGSAWISVILNCAHTLRLYLKNINRLSQGRLRSICITRKSHQIWASARRPFLITIQKLCHLSKVTLIVHSTMIYHKNFPARQHSLLLNRRIMMILYLMFHKKNAHLPSKSFMVSMKQLWKGTTI